MFQIFLIKHVCYKIHLKKLQLLYKWGQSDPRAFPIVSETVGTCLEQVNVFMRSEKSVKKKRYMCVMLWSLVCSVRPP